MKVTLSIKEKLIWQKRHVKRKWERGRVKQEAKISQSILVIQLLTSNSFRFAHPEVCHHQPYTLALLLHWRNGFQCAWKMNMHLTTLRWTTIKPFIILNDSTQISEGKCLILLVAKIVGALLLTILAHCRKNMLFSICINPLCCAKLVEHIKILRQ